MTQIQRLSDNCIIEIYRLGEEVNFQSPTSFNEIWLTKPELEQLITELTELKNQMI